MAQLWPVSGSVVWVRTEDMTGAGGQAVLRTGDGGRHWRDVTPGGFTRQVGDHVISRSFAIDADHAWIVHGGVASDSRQALLLTSDGGRHWQPVGPLPGTGCDIDFVTAHDGWCVAGGAAAGSESVTLYRTRDGGRHWQLASRSASPSTGTPAPPGVLPFDCDKNIAFGSPVLGWAGFACAGGMPPLYRSTDGGSTWHRVAVHAAGVGLSGGAGFSSAPQVVGTRGAAAFTTGDPARTLIYRSDDGGSTWAPVIPPGDPRPWVADILAPEVWRLIDAHSLLGTDDGGRTWFHVTMDHAFARVDLGGVPAPHVFVTRSDGFVAAADGVWRTTTGGRTWIKLRVPRT